MLGLRELEQLGEARYAWGPASSEPERSVGGGDRLLAECALQHVPSAMVPASRRVALGAVFAKPEEEARGLSAGDTA